MKYLTLLISLVLFGCTCTPVIKTVDVKVEVPVTVPCKVPEIPEPVWTADSLKQSDDLVTKTKMLLVEIENRRSYEIKLKAAIKTCNDN